MGYYCSIHDIRLSGLTRILSYYSLFYLGYLVNKLSILKACRNIVGNILGCTIGMCVLIVLNNIGYISLAYNEYTNPVYLLFCALFGGLFVYNIAVIFSNFKHISLILRMAGRSTFSIMVLNFLCFKLINYIGVFWSGKPLCLVAAFPILYTGKYIWLAYTIVGIVGPILCKLGKNAVLNKLSFVIH